MEYLQVSQTHGCSLLQFFIWPDEALPIRSQADLSNNQRAGRTHLKYPPQNLWAPSLKIHGTCNAQYVPRRLCVSTSYHGTNPTSEPWPYHTAQDVNAESQSMYLGVVIAVLFPSHELCSESQNRLILVDARIFIVGLPSHLAPMNNKYWGSNPLLHWISTSPWENLRTEWYHGE